MASPSGVLLDCAVSPSAQDPQRGLWHPRDPRPKAAMVQAILAIRGMDHRKSAMPLTGSAQQMWW
eukprot:scaffold241211_cov30-Tisochrysis_lutea.AAC.1